MNPNPLPKIVPAPIKQKARLKILKLPGNLAKHSFKVQLNELSPQNKILMAGLFENLARLLREKNVITDEDIENAYI